MNITDIFGTHLRDMHSYVGWLTKTDEGANHQMQFFVEKHSEFLASDQFLIRKAHTILSLPMKEEYFVRGSEPIWEDFKGKSYHPEMNSEECLNAHQEDHEIFTNALEKWQNWTPMFKGEWEVKEDGELVLNGVELRVRIKDFDNLNEFATWAKKTDLELELNEGYELD